MQVERVLPFLSTDILDKVANTLQILVGKIQKAAPLNHLYLLEPALQIYDSLCRQLADIGHPRPDIDHKMVLTTYISMGTEFQNLCDTFNSLHKGDTYDQLKLKVREHIHGVEMSHITSKLPKADAPVQSSVHQISNAELVQQAMTSHMLSMGFPSAAIKTLRAGILWSDHFVIR